MPGFQDLTGQRFGRLVVVEKAEREGKSTYWCCLCDCGNTKAIFSGSLKRGVTKSCGCIVKENPPHATHGKSKQNKTAYKSWRELKSRCLNSNNFAYKWYGGRGITVCDRWLESFENFLEDMGERPEGMSIDRIDNNGNYEPGNCRWATIDEQANNRRNNRLVEFNGKTQTLRQWGKELGLGHHAIGLRLRSGWSIEDAFTKPLDRNNKKSNRLIECNGKNQRLSIWAKEIGISRGTISARIKRGWSVEKALFTPIGENKGGWY